MKLKTRISQILSVCLAANVLLGLIVQKWVLLPSFQKLELQEAERVARRCRHAIDQEIEHLNRVCGDWSNWTEMYTFAVDRRPEFIESSLEIDSLMNLDLDYFYVADARKQCICGVSMTPDTGNIASSGEFDDFFGPAAAMLTTPCEGEKTVMGVVSTPSGPMMISARSILASDHQGPTRGVVVMGRLLDGDLVKALGVRICTDLRHQALPVDNEDPGAGRLLQGGFPHIETDGELLRVGSVIPNILGRPAVLVEATIPRDIYESGRISGALAVISIVLASVFFMVLTRFFMHSAVSKPIMGLVDRVMSIASNPHTSASDLRVSRDDEIGLLSNQFHDCFMGLQYRDHLLSAVAEAAGGLLRESEIGVALTSVTASLGRAMRADSVFLCRLDGAGEAGTRVSLRASWSADRHSIPWSVNGLAPEMIETLRKGKSIEGAVATLSGEARGVFETQGIQSILMVPIVAHDDLWGFIVFTSMRMRRWTDTEQALLWAIADSMGSAILRKDTEDALLEARQAANDASRAKSDFLARMSHEIRTPMNGVLGMLDLLGKTTLDDRQQRYTQIAKTSATALLGIINDILDFSKIEAGKMEMALAEIDLWDVIQDAVGLLANRAGEKRLELVCDIGQNVPHVVRGDALRLRQILVNLVSNAVKFTETGTISTEVRLERMAGKFAEVRIAVRDTGCGIREHLQPKLFQVFSQVDSSGVRRFNGSGLGLVICKRLVEMMGGEIGVNSKAGRGSEFWFTAFLEVVSAARTERSLTMSPWKDAMVRAMVRVLAVDDNATNLEILRSHLFNWGFHVETAAGPAEALDTWHRAASAGRCFDLAVVDMDMPEMTGLELARAIKASCRCYRTAVILLSSISELPSQQELEANGCVAGLTKPVRQSDLFDAIVAAAPGAAARSGPAGPQPPATLPDASLAALRREARVLVAEDNAINQEVIREVLTQCGYGVQIVENGRMAVEAVQRDTYDIVFMDCQMPVMDGFAASRTIRELEKSGKVKTGGRNSVPIVALTANALSGDREQCLAAGMSDYLSKPIESAQLMSVVDRVLKDNPARHPEASQMADAVPAPGPEVFGPRRSSPPREALAVEVCRSADPPAAETPVPVFDRASAMRRCMNNEAFLTKMLDKFRDRLPADLAELERVVREVNPQKIAFVAHAIKGAAANLSAERLRMAAQELELGGKAGDFTRMAQLHARVKDEARVCLEALAGGVEQKS